MKKYPVGKNVMTIGRDEIRGGLLVAGIVLSFGGLLSVLLLGVYSPGFAVETFGRGVLVGATLLFFGLIFGVVYYGDEIVAAVGRRVGES